MMPGSVAGGMTDVVIGAAAGVFFAVGRKSDLATGPAESGPVTRKTRFESDSDELAALNQYVETLEGQTETPGPR